MDLRAEAYQAINSGRWFLANPQVLKIRQLLEVSQWWTPDQILEFQNRSLRQLIRYVYEHVPYYHRVMEEGGIIPEDIGGTADLVMLPILNKDTLREHWKQLISDQVDPLRIGVRQTGGTTGEPLRIARDPLNSVYEMGAAYRGIGLSGHHQGQKTVRLFGGSLGLAPKSRVGKVKAQFRGEIFLPAFELRKQNVREYVETIITSKAKILCGYASAIYLFAELVGEMGWEIRMQTVRPTAETLYNYQRRVIRERLGDVFEYYGCGELNSIAFECEAHSGFHISDEHVFLEVLKGEQRSAEGEMGAVTLTTLQNYTMPLIRYQNGDAAVLTSPACPCGRGLGRIAKISGRTNDFLRAKDGRLISGAFIPHLFKETRGIQQVQVIQKTEDLILVKAIKGPEFTDEEMERRIEIIHRYLGDITTNIEYIDSIPTTEAGKLRFVISKIADNF